MFALTMIGNEAKIYTLLYYFFLVFLHNFRVYRDCSHGLNYFIINRGIRCRYNSFT